eukprot:218839-Chlamydomonas_euryale.AAC.11
MGECACAGSFVAQPPSAKWIRLGQPTHTPPQGPQAVKKGREKAGESGKEDEKGGNQDQEGGSNKASRPKKGALERRNKNEGRERETRKQKRGKRQNGRSGRRFSLGCHPGGTRKEEEYERKGKQDGKQERQGEDGKPLLPGPLPTKRRRARLDTLQLPKVKLNARQI